jgi:TonB family protein
MILHSWFAAGSVWIWPRLINHLWQATLFFLMASLVVALLKKGPARWRYSVWLLALARLAVPSLLFVWLGQQVRFDLASLSPQHANVPHSAVQVLPIVSRVVEPISFQPNAPASRLEPKARHSELYFVATLIWLAGLVVLVCWRVRRGLVSWRAVKAGVRVDAGRETEALDRARAVLSVERRIGLVLSSAIGVPGVWGLWRPVVALPERLAEDLSDDEVEAIMMHEVVHVKRRDNLASLFQMGLSCLLWFYPVVWLLERRLLHEREQACDEEVLQGKGSKVYVSGILKVVRFCLDSKMAGVSSVTGSNLKRRIENIMSDPMQRKLTSWHVVSISLFVAVLVMSGVVAASHGNRVTMAQSQKVAAILSGSVYDPSQAAIPGVMIIISSLDGKTKEIVYAGSAGEYKFSLLPDGTYNLESSKEGFRSRQEKNVVITSGKPLRLDLTLEVGEVSQYVEVVGKSPRATPASPRRPYRIRVGGNIQQANLIHEVRPDYPEATRQAGIEGTVSLEAIIAKDGTIVDHRVLNTLTDPSLVEAAAEAIKQWRYLPTRLNGEPIEVVTTITINFRLSEP